MCNRYECSCSEDDVEMDTILENCHMKSISEISTIFYKPSSVMNISREQSFNSDSYELSSTRNAPTVSLNSSNNQHQLPIDLNLSKKGMNMGHLNIQGICGEKLSKLLVLLSSPKNNNVHVFGISETKLKGHKSTNVFKINGFQKPFRKDNCSNGGGGLIVYVRNNINARRREDLETHDIPCLWLEITPTNSKSFLAGNIYRPPTATVEFNDRFEDFIDVISKEDNHFTFSGISTKIY